MIRLIEETHNYVSKIRQLKATEEKKTEEKKEYAYTKL